MKKDLYLETWLKYYSQFFEDIFVVDTEPDVPDKIIEEALKKYKFTVLKEYPNPTWRFNIYNKDIRECQRLLLESYQWVLFAEIDEIIVPDPAKYKDLSDYIKKCKKDFVHCTGQAILQMYQEKKIDGNKREEDLLFPDELDLDLRQPILKQRKYWTYDSSYSKPLLSRIPLAWEFGFHNIVEGGDLELVKNPDLVLCHLKAADYKNFGSRMDGGFSTTDQTDPKDYVWFYRKHESKELIPERFKKVF